LSLISANINANTWFATCPKGVESLLAV